MILRPSTWGPFFWMTIHIIALGYPNEPTYTEKKAARDFFEGLGHLLPCPTCRDHYRQHIQSLPIGPHLDSRADLFKWTLDLHNAVNKSLNKPTWTEAEIIAYLERLGKLERSPIVTEVDLSEKDARSMVFGIGIGAAAIGAAWFASKYI